MWENLFTAYANCALRFFLPSIQARLALAFLSSFCFAFNFGSLSAPPIFSSVPEFSARPFVVLFWSEWSSLFGVIGIVLDRIVDALVLLGRHRFLMCFGIFISLTCRTNLLSNPLDNTIVCGVNFCFRTIGRPSLNLRIKVSNAFLQNCSGNTAYPSVCLINGRISFHSLSNVNFGHSRILLCNIRTYFGLSDCRNALMTAALISHPRGPSSFILPRLVQVKYASNPPTLSIVRRTLVTILSRTVRPKASDHNDLTLMFGRHTRRVRLKNSETLLPKWIVLPPARILLRSL